MGDQHNQIVNEHLKHNSSSDTEEDVRRRRRMAELEAEREQQRASGIKVGEAKNLGAAKKP